ncbi:MAG: RDD family protein [Arhodomonas sp.]|nr:RDD family protein [Arhodomonas sp.]
MDQTEKPCGLLRRLAAIFYDSLLLIGLWMAVTALALLLTDGEAIAAGDWGYRLLLLLIAVVFFCGFWSRSGSTLGMQAWRIRVVSEDGGPVSFDRALTRFGAALLSWLPLGLGFLWSLIDREGLAWHDRLSGTHLVVTEKG